MGYSVYYNGDIGISPKLNEKHEALLEEALRKDSLALLGLTADDERSLYYGCDWRLCEGCLSIEGESRADQDGWLRVLTERFFQPNGYTLSGEVRWEGDQSGDTGVIYIEDNRVEAVADTITNTGPSWCPELPAPNVLELIRAGRCVISHWERGDLAAQVRRLAEALEKFAEIPDER